VGTGGGVLVFAQPFQDLEGEVEAGKVGVALLEQLDDSDALFVMVESAVIGHKLIERGLTGVSEGWMPEVMRQGDGLGEIFVESEGACDAATDGGDFDGMGQAGAVVIAGPIEEDLGLVLESSEGGAVHDAFAIPLEFGAVGMQRLRELPTEGETGTLRIGCQKGLFVLFQQRARQGLGAGVVHDDQPRVEVVMEVGRMLERRLESKELYDEGEFRIVLARYRMQNGRIVTRPVLEHPPSVLVVPELPEGRLQLVRQFRAGLDRVTLEFPCGKVHPGEALTDAARRETAEEAGCAVRTLTLIGEIVPAPGLSSEIIHLYGAKVDLIPAEAVPAPDLDEAFERVAMTSAELASAIESGGVTDAKTVAAYYRWAKQRGED
jgi:ADP-ribose pyrophosphatase